ncbi:unnamed protein product [Dovyalis caffra]|uniref:Uncharacterized protein n=1 Tax=Dovyalis caffra TaxID=77055 RepID=A0AAV1SSD7_9ROSI|nr:unnamed protein product [Dovyalis caffra]
MNSLFELLLVEELQDQENKLSTERRHLKRTQFSKKQSPSDVTGGTGTGRELGWGGSVEPSDRVGKLKKVILTPSLSDTLRQTSIGQDIWSYSPYIPDRNKIQKINRATGQSLGWISLNHPEFRGSVGSSTNYGSKCRRAAIAGPSALAGFREAPLDGLSTSKKIIIIIILDALLLLYGLD